MMSKQFGYLQMEESIVRRLNPISTDLTGMNPIQLVFVMLFLFLTKHSLFQKVEPLS